MYGKNSLKFYENSYNCFPYVTTHSWNMEKPQKIEMTVDSMHFDDDHANNVTPKFLITSKLLKKQNSLKGVTIKIVDITSPVKGLKSLDPTKMTWETANIGRLTQSHKKTGPWHANFQGPVMCVYKLVKVR